MKNILLLCTTHYQLLVLLQLKNTILKNDTCDIALINLNFDDKSLVKEALTKELKFRKVLFLENTTSKMRKSSLFFRCCFGKKNPTNYDCFFSFNYDILAHAIFADLYRNNRRIECYQFEEGLLSYITRWKKTKFLSFLYLIRALLFKKNPRSIIKKFYCFEPKLYEGCFVAEQIEKICIDRFSKVLKMIYPNITNVYGDKIVYLSSIYDKEGGESIGEFGMIANLSKTIGKDNLVVRLHPRDERDKYNAFFLDPNKNAPWEAITILLGLNNLVISSFSGSLLNLSILLSDSGNYLYTYNLFDTKNVLSNNYKRALIYFIQKIKNKKLFVINDENEMYERIWIINNRKAKN